MSKSLIIFLFLVNLNVWAQQNNNEEVRAATKEELEIDFTELTEEEIKGAKGIEKRLLQRRLNPRISNKYNRGRYLIYDCVDKHYACVFLDNLDKCRKDRDKALEDNRFSLPCAPLKVFNTQKDCFKEAKKRVEDLEIKEFCQNKSDIKL